MVRSFRGGGCRAPSSAGPLSRTLAVLKATATRFNAGTSMDDTDAYRGPVGRLRHRCSQCTATGPKLLQCSGCLAVRYCSHEHQAAHRPQHKSACTKIRKARVELAREDDGVRNATPDFGIPANAFETEVGQFWDILSTRDYMCARFELAWALLLQGTLDGAQQALEHMLDMLILCRSDNMRVRDIVPALMLRLDLDQECYDLVKLWATCSDDGDHNGDDMTLPHLNLRGTDILEEPGFLCRKSSQLSGVVAVLLLKLKLLVDVRNLKIARKLLAQRAVPPELWKNVELAAVRSPLSAPFQKKPSKSLAETEAKLLKHTRQLGAALVQANHHFMFHLLDEPGEALDYEPLSYTRGSWEEMALAMQHSYAAWWETEGVLDLLKDARVCGAGDSEDEIQGMVEGETFRSGLGSGRTSKELLADVSLNWIWDYLGYAVENASYLGPWSKRPSERQTRENKEAYEAAELEDADA